MEMCEIDLNHLVTNVLSENSYSHCRLCLQDTQKNFVRFDDCVSCDPNAKQFHRLSNVLSSIFGEEILDKIPGVDAVCTRCIERLMESYNFIEQSKEYSNLLHKIFLDLKDSLSVVVEPPKKSQQLYVFVGPDESKVMLVDREEKENPAPRRKKITTKAKQYYCEECECILIDQTELKMHNLTVHGTITCDKCTLTFTEQTHLDAHVMADHGFKCSACHQYKESKESLQDHIVRAHQPRMCPDCGKTYKGLDKLQAHELKHQYAKKVCPKCGKSYVIKQTFEKHMQLCLENRIELHPFRADIAKTYTCSHEKCRKAYSTYGGLRVHQRFVHGNATPHICDHCGKKFTAPSYLKTHLLTHTGIKNFACDICNQKLVSKEALLYHKRRHTGEKPYSCKMCSERFVNASARAEHVKFKHTEPTLSCDFCYRKFFTKNFLRQHIARHHDPSSKLYAGMSTTSDTKSNSVDDAEKNFKIE